MSTSVSKIKSARQLHSIKKPNKIIKNVGVVIQSTVPSFGSAQSKDKTTFMAETTITNGCFHFSLVLLFFGYRRFVLCFLLTRKFMSLPGQVDSEIRANQRFLTTGLIYDVIVEPPSVGSTTDENGHTRPVS